MNRSPADTVKHTPHTPGPWSYSWETQDRDWAIVTDVNGWIVANVNTETGPDVHSAPAMRQMPAEANAYLIAAAPDLLAFAESARDFAREANDEAMYADADAVIAKAEGRS